MSLEKHIFCKQAWRTDTLSKWKNFERPPLVKGNLLVTFILNKEIDSPGRHSDVDAAVTSPNKSFEERFEKIEKCIKSKMPDWTR